MTFNKYKTYSDISLAHFDCIKKSKEYGQTYDPIDANNGVVKQITPFGTMGLEFYYNPDEKTLTYKVVAKPGMITINMFLKLISDPVESCRS